MFHQVTSWKPNMVFSTQSQFPKKVCPTFGKSDKFRWHISKGDSGRNLMRCGKENKLNVCGSRKEWSYIYHPNLKKKSKGMVLILKMYHILVVRILNLIKNHNPLMYTNKYITNSKYVIFFKRKCINILFTLYLHI